MLTPTLANTNYSLVTDYSFCCMGLAYEVTSSHVGARKGKNVEKMGVHRPH